MRRSQLFTWIIALSLAVAAHAGLFWAVGMFGQDTSSASRPLPDLQIDLAGVAAAPRTDAGQNSPAESLPPRINPTTSVPAATPSQPQKPLQQRPQSRPALPNQPSVASIRLETAQASKPKPQQSLPASIPAVAATATRSAQRPANSDRALDGISPPPAPRQNPSPTPTDARQSAPQLAMVTPVASTTPVDLDKLDTVGSGSADYFAQVRAILLNAKIYPLQSKRLGEEGSVQLELQLDRSGHLLSHRLLQPSRYLRLNTAVDTTLARAAPFPAAPAAVSDAQLRMRYTFELRLQTAP